MKKENFRYLESLRVRWAEVDMQKIVFNVHYLMYVDTAIAGYWRALALPYSDTMADLEGDLFVRKSSIEYFASAEYDDRLEVGLRCARMGNSSMTFEAAVFRGEETLVTAELVYVFAHPQEHKSRPIPALLRHTLESFEAGEPMAEVVRAPWGEGKAAIAALRSQVFVEEGGKPSSWVEDDADPLAEHHFLRNRLGRCVGAARLVRHPGDVGHLSHLAVLRGVRGSGFGAQLMRAMEDRARSQGIKQLTLEAPTSCAKFFESAGFAAQGDPKDIEGRAHQPMVRML